jgi:transcriptional regulator with XRE-family HTH domain
MELPYGDKICVSIDWHKTKLYLDSGRGYIRFVGRKEVDALPSRLRAARREHQHSLSDFANRVGYSRSYLSAVELGHLPETEQIVLAYEAALGLERGSLREGKQSVARILHRVSHLASASSLEAVPGVSLPEGRMLVLPREDVLQAMASLADEVVQLDATPDEVFLTSFSPADDWRVVEAAQQPWTSLQQNLLHAGWAINHLIRLDEDVGRSLMLTESMLGLLAADTRYRAMYAPPGTALPPANDCFVIPGHCALLRFDTGDRAQQAVMLVRDRAAVAALAENCGLLLASMRPLIESISRDDPVEFNRHLAQVEKAPGERALVLGALSMDDSEAALPEMGWIPSAHLASGGSERDDAFFRRQRYERFLNAVRRHRIRHIYSKRRIEETVEASRNIGAGLLLLEEDDLFQPANVRRRLQRLINSLNSFENYEVALLDREEEGLIEAPQSESVVYWLVQGSELLLESWPHVATGEARHLHIAVHESSIASAFMEHFKNVWARINPLNREKKYVVWWLEQLVQSLSPYS